MKQGKSQVRGHVAGEEVVRETHRMFVRLDATVRRQSCHVLLKKQ